MDQDNLQKAGAVFIKELKLISSKNLIIDLTEFVVELNIFEDIFSNYLQGNMVITDSRNLIEFAPIIGEEYIVVNVQTPSFPTPIKKTFRVYKLTDRNIVRDNNTQNYILHFASIELFNDILLPLYIPFEGEIHEVAGRIFSDFIVSTRNYKIGQGDDTVTDTDDETPLILLNEAANKVKFVSPGWTPFKCLNWLASKAIPKQLKAKNFLFFESSKAFYFGSIEHIVKEAKENNLYIGTYFHAASNIRGGSSTPDVNREFFIAKDISMTGVADHVKNYTNGYLASRLITLDIHNKNYEITDYDYVEEYKNQYHTSGEGDKARSIFATDTLRNSLTHISFYPINPKLFTGFPDNISEKIKDVYGNRRSSMLDLSNLRLNITVPGRTDVEVGNMLYFRYPAMGAADDQTKEKDDELYSGYYLISAIHHKINKIEHTMTMELVKDSLIIKGE